MAVITKVREAVGSSRPAREKDPQRRTLLGIGLVIAAFLVFFPTKQLVVQRTRMARLETRLEVLTEENRRLERQVDRLQDPGELELLARARLGLVKPGEQAYLLVATPSPSPAVRATGQPKRPWPSRAWDWVTDLFGD
ncbi:MAG TPA: septum formation initiator family protein [Actinomycetota bacterium]|nr:septum formation initiator family protein [Actinomycetota bacterium]